MFVATNLNVQLTVLVNAFTGQQTGDEYAHVLQNYPIEQALPVLSFTRCFPGGRYTSSPIPAALTSIPTTTSSIFDAASTFGSASPDTPALDRLARQYKPSTPRVLSAPSTPQTPVNAEASSAPFPAALKQGLGDPFLCNLAHSTSSKLAEAKADAGLGEIVNTFPMCMTVTLKAMNTWCCKDPGRKPTDERVTT